MLNVQNEYVDILMVELPFEPDEEGVAGLVAERNGVDATMNRATIYATGSPATMIMDTKTGLWFVQYRLQSQPQRLRDPQQPKLRSRSPPELVRLRGKEPERRVDSEWRAVVWPGAEPKLAALSRSVSAEKKLQNVTHKGQKVTSILLY